MAFNFTDILEMLQKKFFSQSFVQQYQGKKYRRIKYKTPDSSIYKNKKIFSKNPSLLLKDGAVTTYFFMLFMFFIYNTSFAGIFWSVYSR